MISNTAKRINLQVYFDQQRFGFITVQLWYCSALFKILVDEDQLHDMHTKIEVN